MGQDFIIEVENLTKRYAGHTAVAGVSFTVAPGEIVGLLGPNGAGKSTILRVLSCFMPATTGTVRVGGFDAYSQSAEVRRRIGYMPENNPLHLDMRIAEYLKFRARLKGVRSGQIWDRVSLVMEQCGLTDVSRKIIGQLSKGFRQRVGLADALVHDPDLIILDEPTIGLDPHQIREVRRLIKDLGRSHTVLLSTHLLPEVEMTCTRVLILHEGRILAADTTENLQNRFNTDGQVVAEIAAPFADLNECWREMELVEHFDVSPAEGAFFRCALTPRSGVDLRPLVFEAAHARGWKLRELTRSRHTLEDIFVRVIRADQEDGNLMQIYLSLLRRELSGYFNSFSGYVIIAAVLFLLGLSFNDILSKMDTAMEAPLTEGFFVTFYFWIIFLLTAPVMTIRTFALERFSGTYETLMTSPVGDLQVVLAKFTGALLFYAMTWLPLLGYLLILRRYSDDPAALDMRVVLSTFLGILLLGAVYMAVGCFASAVTRSQTVAAMVSYALGLTLFLFSMRALVPVAPDRWDFKIYSHIAMTQHMEQFSRGAVDTSALTYDLSLTVFFLFLTWKVIEGRRWR